MITRFALITLLLLVLVRASIGACATPAGRNCAQTAPVCLSQPPLCGYITIVQPDGQFYTDLSAKDQIYCQAEVRILRRGNEIGRAKLIKVDLMDSIGQLLPAYQGLRYQTGDSVELIATPLPDQMRDRLPDIEIDLEAENNEALAFEILGSLIGIGIAIDQD